MFLFDHIFLLTIYIETVIIKRNQKLHSMKKYIILLICFGYSMAYAQEKKRDTIISGVASWTWFSSNVYLVLETKNDSIQTIFFEEDITASNQVIGSFNLKNKRNNVNDNRISFNNKKANQMIRMYIGPNFDPISGGLLIFSLYKDEKWSPFKIMHIRKEDYIWKIFYLDIVSKKTHEYEILYIEFTLTLGANRIKKSIIKTPKGIFGIYPKFEKK